MNPQYAAGRLPLKVGLRLYWKHLVPLMCYPAALASVVRVVGDRWAFLAFWLSAPVFFGCGYFAYLPWWKKKVSYNYILFVGCCWLFVSPILLVLAVLTVNAAFHLR
jgi:hypothetical protein